MRKQVPDGTMIFGGRKDFERRAAGLIDNAEWRTRRLLPLASRGDKTQLGNRHFRLSPDALTCSFAVYGRRFELQLARMTGNAGEILRQAAQLAAEKLINVMFRIDATHLHVTIDPEGLPKHPERRNPVAALPGRSVGIDLNPGWIGIAAVENTTEPDRLEETSLLEHQLVELDLPAGASAEQTRETLAATCGFPPFAIVTGQAGSLPSPDQRRGGRQHNRIPHGNPNSRTPLHVTFEQLVYKGEAFERSKPMPQPPALNNRIRKEIAEKFIDLDQVWHAGKGEPGREDLERVIAASLEPLVKIKKIQLDYQRRMIVAMDRKDTLLLLAAVYGLQCDMRGRPGKASFHEDDFVKSLFMRAARISSHGQIQRWYDTGKYSTFGAHRERRALIEFFDDKLAELDVLVRERYPEASESAAPLPSLKP